MDSKESYRSWFCVLNNPQNIYSGEPHEIAEKCLDDWRNEHPTRTGAVAYCISKDGLHHLHMVLEDSNKARFSALKKTYPKAHLEPTKGNKVQAEDYINKRGKFKEVDEKVLYIARFGEIKGNQGQRKDLEIIEDLINQGKTPNEIMDMNIVYRKYEKYIKDAYFRKLLKETPPMRDIRVYWHVGDSGTGKTFEYIKLIEKYGEDSVYMVNEYKNGFDWYCGEHILFLDEFRGQIKYGLLLTYLSGYKTQIPCRYTNGVALWNEVHITSVLPPETAYKNMVQESREHDTLDQLLRRINAVIYHYKIENKYYKDEIPMSEYENYDSLKSKYQDMPLWVYEAENSVSDLLTF